MTVLSGCGASIANKRCAACGRPALLDAFSGAGGAGMGYHRAGFCPAGVDIEPQPHYPFHFVRASAVDVDEDGQLTGGFVVDHAPDFSAVHASCPCQHYAAVTAWRGEQSDHPDLVGPTREALMRSGVPWVIENVPEAPIRSDYLLCGSAVGLRVRRHRSFETSWRHYELATGCRHFGLLAFMHKGERAYADAMECTWMTSVEAREAIPPRYTEHIGHSLMAQALKSSGVAV